MSTWVDIDAYLSKRGVRIGAPTIGQTTGGIHATNSYHYKGQARDYGSVSSDLDGVWEALLPFAQGPGHQLVELFGPKGAWKAGKAISEVPGHKDHVHAAIKSDGVLTIGGDVPNDVPAARELIAFQPTPSGNGYWILARDGAVYAFGDAQYLGGLAWDGNNWGPR